MSTSPSCAAPSAPTSPAPDLSTLLASARPSVSNGHRGKRRTFKEALEGWLAEGPRADSLEVRLFDYLEDLRRNNAQLRAEVAELRRGLSAFSSSGKKRASGRTFRCKRVRAAARLLAYLFRAAESKTAFDPQAAKAIRELSEPELFDQTRPYHARLAEACKASHRLHHHLARGGNKTYWLLPAIALCYLVLEVTGEKQPEKILHKAFGPVPPRDFTPVAQLVKRLRARRSPRRLRRLSLRECVWLLGSFVYCYEDTLFDDCLSGILASQFDPEKKGWPTRVIRAVTQLKEDAEEEG